MKLLEERIRKDGRIKEGGILKVDGFLNHQMDMALYEAMGQEFHRLYEGSGVNKILTIEASGIGIACITGQIFGVPVLFAKKSRTKNIDGEVYLSKVHSYTHGVTYDVIVSSRFLGPEDRVLLIDDFLARGQSLLGLADIVSQAGATLVGCGIAVEKCFQEGGRILRERGIRVESLAMIESMHGDSLTFRGE